jgi:peptide/nickel transport system substrate-binding protein
MTFTRRFTAAVAAAIAALAIAAAPADAATLRWAAQNDILTMDPHSQNHATTHSLLAHSYESLVRYT